MSSKATAETLLDALRPEGPCLYGIRVRVNHGDGYATVLLAGPAPEAGPTTLPMRVEQVASIALQAALGWSIFGPTMGYGIETLRDKTLIARVPIVVAGDLLTPILDGFRALPRYAKVLGGEVLVDTRMGS
jgi:hypothetical protein